MFNHKSPLGTRTFFNYFGNLFRQSLYKSKFPYGQSHCCIIGVEGALEQYAMENAGRYPTGESCPEASLSLLCRSNYLDAYTIRGMIVPEKKRGASSFKATEAQARFLELEPLFNKILGSFTLL
jgi:hypothetical protein